MANEEHLALLKQGVNEWNQWRKQNRKIIPDLSQANLGNLNLNNFDLKRANLERANFSRTSLNNAQLINANLQGANFLGADLRGANFKKANLNYVIFSEALINSETIIDANSYRVWEIVNLKNNQKNFQHLDLSYANLFRADLSRADLSHAKLYRTNLSNANLQDAYLYQTNLSQANLHNANLTNAYFRQANLTQAYLGDACCYGTYLKDTELKLANLKATKINHKTIIAPRWFSVWEIINRGAVKKNLTGIDLSDTNLQGANLESANLTNANLSNSILRKSNLNFANLTNTDLTGANLCGVDLSNAILDKTKFISIVTDSNTNLPNQFNTNTKIQTQKLATANKVEAPPRKSSLQKRLGWLFMLGLIGLIIAGGYFYLLRNPGFQWRQPLERFLPAT